MYGGGYYRMDSMGASRPYYNGYQNTPNPNTGYSMNQNRSPFYGGGNGAANQGTSPATANGGRAGKPLAGAYAGQGPTQTRQMKNAPPVSQLGRTASFSQQHGNAGMGRQQSYGSFNSAFGSFRGYNGSNASGVSNPDSQLPRASSGVGFGYSYGSFVQNPSMGSAAGGNTSLMNVTGSQTNGARAAPAAYNGNNTAGGGNLSRNGSMYSYGSFANGLPGMGPGTSIGSMGSQNNSAMGSGYGDFAANNVTPPSHGPEDKTSSGNDADNLYNLQRQDSQNQLQRQYSVAGQFYNFGAMNNGMGMYGGVKPGVMLNGRSGGVMAGAGGGLGNLMMQRPGGPQQQQQRRLGDSGMKGSDDGITEGEPTALGRKNSVSNLLERKDSQKRVGMYFKNKEANQEDVEYKKDGDPGTTKTASSKSRDPSLVNNVKPILLFDASEDGSDGKGVQNDIEIDGKTVRGVKPGNEEVQKYDMREIMFVNTREDVEVNGDSLDELRDQFFNGANVGMLMADADVPAAEPTEWFTWNALKTVMKNVFAKVDMIRTATASSSHYAPKFEVTISVCVLQDDQMLDLLGDDSNFDTDDYHMENLVVAESPLFGNVPNNAVFVVVENADEFNDTLDACLERARGFFYHDNVNDGNNKNLDDVAEYGIVLATCVLKQTRKSTTSGKFDVVVSSIFASGVGNGVIHYNRIMDKNPAEPRALFYSVLHRSCHSTAIFSLKQNNADIFNALSTLQRFSKVELRKPKLGSVRQFLYYTESTMPKIREDVGKMKEGRQKIQTQRFMERLELMSQDMEQMLEDPEGCVPKTYI